MIPDTSNDRFQIGDTMAVESAEQQPTRTFHIDFERGRIIGFIDEHDAMEQAIYMILRTERFDHLIYSFDYGVELKQVMGRNYAVMESELERVMTEALTADARITAIEHFKVELIDKRTAAVSFTAVSIFGNILITSEVNV
ncbi:DUF2634 domain-containing protein [Paenibacillus sp. GCM10027627]|uniref:DUF2634 domain-containing protein n=1 Tax=unclassified Paenibacillus TaxID=185978 RepID=UPI00363C52C1